MFFITSFGMPTWGDDDNDGDCIWIVCDDNNGCCGDGVDGFTTGLDGDCDCDIGMMGKGSGGGGGNGVSIIQLWFNYWIEEVIF